MGHVLVASTAERSAFRARLLRWYRSNRRPLPWRQTSDPYRIWVSEIMLQQTRVAAVVEHYHRFLARFPDLPALAAARLPAVLAAWSGLGYYRRARSLHAAARLLVKEWAGRLPRTAEQLRLLPGFGPYTAAAVASIAFRQPCAVLDGNVERVLRRLLGTWDANIGSLWEVAGLLLSRRHPGDFNQAMMEVGATVCLPLRSDCQRCPLRRWCRTRGVQRPRSRPARLSQNIAVVLDRKQGCVCLVRRPESASLMPGMWELPPLPVAIPVPGPPVLVLRHAILNTTYRVGVYAGNAPRVPGSRRVRISRAMELPLTGLARKILLHSLSLSSGTLENSK
jgi:A/G-specific adenine glycosylase